MTDIDDAWLKAEANAFRNAGMENIHPAGAAQDPELAKYQRAMPNKPLTKPPGHYLTGYEGSPCEMLEPAKIGENTIKFNIVKDPSLGANEWFLKGIDTDEFKKQCEDIDKGES